MSKIPSDIVEENFYVHVTEAGQVIIEIQSGYNLRPTELHIIAAKLNEIAYYLRSTKK